MADDDDYDRRRRESNDYLDRMRDQAIFEETLRTRKPEIPPPDFEPIVEAEKVSEGALETRILQQRQDLLDYLKRSPSIPSRLRTDWLTRLMNLTEANSDAEFERLSKEVNTACERAGTYADIYNPSSLFVIESDLRHVSMGLLNLSILWSRYKSGER